MNLQSKDSVQQTKLPPHNYCSQKLQHLYLDGGWLNYISMTMKKWKLVSELLLHKEQGNLMRLFGLVSAFNIYLLFLFSQRYQFSCWQALWQEPRPLWSELEPWHCRQWQWGVSFFYPSVLLMELKMNMAFLCVWTVTSHCFFRVLLFGFLCNTNHQKLNSPVLLPYPKQ